MTTITIWLLLSGPQFRANVQVVERFPTLQQCEHVQRAVREVFRESATRCVQATIVVPIVKEK